MEIDRVQQVTGLKVERTGSESERRRHQQPEHEFSELLEQSLSDGARDQEHKDEQQSSPQARDTVSLSSTAPLAGQPTLDLVSISSAARIGAEAIKARTSTLKLSLVQRTVQGLRLEIPPTANGQRDAAKHATPDKPEPGSLDTVA